MAWKRMVLEIGMGTDIRGTEPTKAAERALRNALWRNALTASTALGLDTDGMRIEVTIGVPDPGQVDKDVIVAVLPHGTGTVTVAEGGLRIPDESGTDATLLAHAAAVVYMDIPESQLS
ncbi:MAG: hypothetical protein GKR94_24200 [Gammaproteobacteria bacterium]|nr:hypothetical protein [Gammaproteobacteria bacterium]